MINIVIIDPGSTDACCLLRGLGPFTHLRRVYGDINLIVNPKLDWNAAVLGDIIFMNHPCSIETLNFMKLAKLCGSPVWADYTDDFLNIPIDHPSHNYFGKKETKDITRACMKESTVITTHCDELLESYKQINPNTKIIPHAIPDMFLAARKEPKLDRTKEVFWRGSRTHERALLEFAPAILECAKEFATWKWRFIGQNPWYITEHLKEKAVVTEQWVDATQCLQVEHAEQPAIHMVCHCDIPFSRARGYEGWQEATYSGAITVAPDFPVWRKPGVVLYKDKHDFVGKMKTLMHSFNTGISHKEEVDAAWAHIQENYLLSSIEHYYIDIIKGLVKSKGSILE